MLVTILNTSEHYDYEINGIELLDQLHIQFALSNYRRILKEMKKLEAKIEEINDQKHKLPTGIVKRGENHHINKNSILLELMEKEQLLLVNYRGYQYYNRLADNFINSLSEPVKSIVVDKYIRLMRWSTVERKHNFSRRQMNRMIIRYVKLFKNDEFN